MLHSWACIHIQCKDAFHKKSLLSTCDFVPTFCDLDKVVSMLMMLKQSYWADMDTTTSWAQGYVWVGAFLCRWPRSPKQHLSSYFYPPSQGTNNFYSGCLTGCFFCFSRFQWILGRSFSTWAHGFVSTRGRCEKAQLRFVGCYVKTHLFRWWNGLGNLTVKHSQDSLQAFGIFECNMNYTGWQKRSIILTSAWFCFFVQR